LFFCLASTTCVYVKTWSVSTEWMSERTEPHPALRHMYICMYIHRTGSSLLSERQRAAEQRRWPWTELCLISISSSSLPSFSVHMVYMQCSHFFFTSEFVHAYIRSLKQQLHKRRLFSSSLIS